LAICSIPFAEEYKKKPACDFENCAVFLPALKPNHLYLKSYKNTEGFGEVISGVARNFTIK